MEVTRIVIRKSPTGGWDVEDSGLVCANLTWDEMLGHVATLTHPDIKAPRYRRVPVEEVR